MAVKTKGISRREIASILRSARNKMNSKGAHWTQGDEKTKKRMVLKKVEDPEFSYMDWVEEFTDMPKGEHAFCSIGGIKEVIGNGRKVKRTNPVYQATIIVLARAIDPQQVAYMEKYASESYDYYVEDEKLWGGVKVTQTREEYIAENIFENCESLVIENNDQAGTQWEDVKGWFTRAARSLR